MTDVIERKPNGQFQQGSTGNLKGRPKGSRNKLGEAFIADMYDAWSRRGMEAIEKTIDEKPDAFIRSVGAILPQQMEIKTMEGELSDEQLDALSAAVDAALAIRAAAEPVGRGRSGSGGKAAKGGGRKTQEA
jgi:hypothetical protein